MQVNYFEIMPIDVCTFYLWRVQKLVFYVLIKMKKNEYDRDRRYIGPTLTQKC